MPAKKTKKNNSLANVNAKSPCILDKTKKKISLTTKKRNNRVLIISPDDTHDKELSISTGTSKSSRSNHTRTKETTIKETSSQKGKSDNYKEPRPALLLQSHKQLTLSEIPKKVPIIEALSDPSKRKTLGKRKQISSSSKNKTDGSKDKKEPPLKKIKIEKSTDSKLQKSKSSLIVKKETDSKSKSSRKQISDIDTQSITDTLLTSNALTLSNTTTTTKISAKKEKNNSNQPITQSTKVSSKSDAKTESKTKSKSKPKPKGNTSISRDMILGGHALQNELDGFAKIIQDLQDQEGRIQEEEAEFENIFTPQQRDRLGSALRKKNPTPDDMRLLWECASDFTAKAKDIQQFGKTVRQELKRVRDQMTGLVDIATGLARYHWTTVFGIIAAYDDHTWGNPHKSSHRGEPLGCVF